MECINSYISENSKTLDPAAAFSNIYFHTASFSCEYTNTWGGNIETKHTEWAGEDLSCKSSFPFHVKANKHNNSVRGTHSGGMLWECSRYCLNILCISRLCRMEEVVKFYWFNSTNLSKNKRSSARIWCTRCANSMVG